MIVLIIINMFLTFFALCGIAAIDNKLDRILNNQDIINVIKKANKR